MRFLKTGKVWGCLMCVGCLATLLGSAEMSEESSSSSNDFKRQQTIASFNNRPSSNAQHQSSLSIQYNTIIINFSGIIKSDTMDAFHYSIYRRIFAIITFRQAIGDFTSI